MSYLFFIESSDGTRLADAAYKTLKAFLPMILAIEEKDWDSKNFLTSLREGFVNKMKEIEKEEEGVFFSEKQIGHSIIFGGADGFVNMCMERMLSKEEKIEVLAKLTLIQLQKVLSERPAESEEKILQGLLQKTIEQEIRLIQRQKSLEELERRKSLAEKF